MVVSNTCVRWRGGVGLGLLCDRTDIVRLEETYQYNDTAKDLFEREPFCAKFSCSKAGESPRVVKQQLHLFSVLYVLHFQKCFMFVCLNEIQFTSYLV